MGFVFVLLSGLLLFSFLFLYIVFSSKININIGKKCRRPPLPPGPRGWPILGNLPHLGARPHHTLHALSRTYGPLLRLRLGSVDVIVASSAAVAAHFLRTHDANFSNRPPNSGAEHIAYNYRDLVFAPYGPRWRALRRLCALHLFSTRALDDLRPVRASEVALLVGRLARAEGLELEVGRVLGACVTNALARAVVGRRVFEEEDEGGVAAAGEFKEMVVELMRLAGTFNVGDFVPGLGWLDVGGVVRKMKRLHLRFDAFLDRIIKEHRAAEEGGAGEDLLSVLLRLEEEEQEDGEGGKLTYTEIKALLLNLFTAGTDTTSSTVEWALAELIRRPDILKQAQLELDSVVGRARLVSEADLHRLPLLHAVVKETFRLHPSTPLSLPRISSRPCDVLGFHVPARATLLVNVWAIARDPATWPDPLSFRPDRFLPGGPHAHVDVKGNDFELIPFGAGRRICAGMSLGVCMVQFLTAALLHAFDWALPAGQTLGELDMEEAYGLALHRASPLLLRPLPRLHPEAYVAHY